MFDERKRKGEEDNAKGREELVNIASTQITQGSWYVFPIWGFSEEKLYVYLNYTFFRLYRQKDKVYKSLITFTQGFTVNIGF